MRENEQAVQFYKEAIKYAPQDLLLMAALAKLHMQMNAMELCQQVCAQILQVESKNEAASVMMADLSFRKVSRWLLRLSLKILKIIWFNNPLLISHARWTLRVPPTTFRNCC